MTVAVKGVNQTLIDTGGIVKLTSGLKDGRVKACIDSYTTDGSEVVGSTISFGGALPAGANIVNVSVCHEDLGAGVTYSVGDSNGAARYIAAGTDGHAAAKETCKLAAGIGYIIGTNSGDTQLLLTTAGATLTAAKLIKFVIEYTLD